MSTTKLLGRLETLVREVRMSDWDQWISVHGPDLGRIGKSTTAVTVADLTARFGRAGIRTNDGMINTFRHTMWSALLSVRFSQGGRVPTQQARELTRTWTEAHELLGNLRSLDTAVDRFNNQAGIEIGQQLVADGFGTRSYLSLRTELARRVAQHASDGKLAYWRQGESTMRRTNARDLGTDMLRLAESG